MVWPGFVRTMMFSHQYQWSSSPVSFPRTSGSAPSGITTSNLPPTSGPKNPGGVTPTIVNGTRFNVS